MLLTDNASIRSACEALRAAGIVAFDTEFVFERTYRPALGLVQLAAPEGPAVAIDPLAGADLEPVWSLLLDERVLKVVHAGLMDWSIVYAKTGGRLPRRAFDTQIAASFLGLGAQIGYANLVDQLTGVHIDKGETQTDWLRRPLSERQIEYAIADVTHLLIVYESLVARADARGRAAWIEEECARTLDPARYADPDPREVFRSLKRAAAMRRPELAVLRELAAWREIEARTRDLRPHFVLRDDVLVATARRAPTSPKDLSQVRGFPGSEVERSGERLIEAVRRARALPASEWPMLERGAESDPFAEVSLSLLAAFVAMRARDLEMTPELIATRNALRALLRDGVDARGDGDGPVLSSWRRELLGPDFEALLSGRAALAIEAGTRRPRIVRLSGGGE
jgi:ribonuclease D